LNRQMRRTKKPQQGQHGKQELSQK
jgi:hypothetical protein